jgi:hypothetical protein
VGLLLPVLGGVGVGTAEGHVKVSQAPSFRQLVMERYSVSQLPHSGQASIAPQVMNSE